MAEKKSKPASNIGDSDIFEGFNVDEKLKKDVDNFNKQEKRGPYEYLYTLGNILKYINTFMFLVLIVVFLYIFVQKDEDLSESGALIPFCSIILGDVPAPGDGCSSITYALNHYTDKLNAEKVKQFDSIVNIIQPLYTSIDFLNSGDVGFLLNKGKSRLRPLAILNEFDEVKNGFEGTDKSALQCYSFEINNEDILEARCDIYSSDWDQKITLPDGDKWESNNFEEVGGTSISLASSFLNFIEKKSTKFVIIDKPKDFSFENISGENSGYTKKTTFSIKLKYNSGNLSL